MIPITEILSLCTINPLPQILTHTHTLTTYMHTHTHITHATVCTCLQCWHYQPPVLTYIMYLPPVFFDSWAKKVLALESAQLKEIV